MPQELGQTDRLSRRCRRRPRRRRRRGQRRTRQRRRGSSPRRASAHRSSRRSRSRRRRLRTFPRDTIGSRRRSDCARPWGCRVALRLRSRRARVLRRARPRATFQILSRRPVRHLLPLWRSPRDDEIGALDFQDVTVPQDVRELRSEEAEQHVDGVEVAAASATDVAPRLPPAARDLNYVVILHPGDMDATRYATLKQEARALFRNNLKHFRVSRGLIQIRGYNNT